MAHYDHHFRRNGGGCFGRWKDSRENRKLLEFVLRLASASPRIVEVGPGIGHFAMQCKTHGIEYEAIEPNHGRADFVQSLGHHVHRAPVPPIPLPENHCDILFASQVIEHMPDQQTALEFVEEARRIVRPGGWVVLTAPDISSWREFFWEDYTHGYPTSPRRMLTMFQDLELADNRLREYCSSCFGPMRYLILTIGVFFPYGLFNRLLRSSLNQGFLFNLKAATLARFVIAGRVPTGKRAGTRLCRPRMTFSAASSTNGRTGCVGQLSTRKNTTA
ncbi:MAG: class I SAM-dependent methyltransferase [Planctomycetota bacterium]